MTSAADLLHQNDANSFVCNINLNRILPRNNKEVDPECVHVYLDRFTRHLSISSSIMVSTFNSRVDAGLSLFESRLIPEMNAQGM